MLNTLNPDLSAYELQNTGIAALAHVGDAVYDLMTRTALCINGAPTAAKLHTMTTERVCAEAQAKAARAVMPRLDKEESAVFQRGRNTKMRASRADSEDYMLATALEALFGYLYLTGKTERLTELMRIIDALREVTA